MVNPAVNEVLSDMPEAVALTEAVATSAASPSNPSKRYAYWLVAAFVVLTLLALASLVVA